MRNDTALMKSARKISPRRRFTAFALGGVTLFLFGVTAKLIQQEYRIAVNPRVLGRIEQTWVIIRGNRNQHVRVANLSFTVTHAGKPIDCHVEGLDIGDGDFAAKAGDSIELSPIPESCERPYVINVQPPTWVYWALTAAVAGAGFLFALFTLVALSDARSRRGSSSYPF
jgi:hypothetical protein